MNILAWESSSIKQILLGLLLCLGMSLILFTAQAFFDTESAYGVQIEVTSSDDSGSGTLRQAIVDAGTSGDIIAFNFAADTTITLSSALENDTKSFAIENSGAGLVTIVAASNYTVFDIAGGDIAIKGCTLVGNGTQSVISVTVDPNAVTNLTLGGSAPSEGVTITGGGNSGVNYRGAGTLDLAGNVIITNNSNPVQGGGIFVQSDGLGLAKASFLISGSAVIQDNSAPKGKDVYYSGEESIGLGGATLGSKIVVGSAYTNVDFSTGTAPIVIDNWISSESSIRIEPFATEPPVGSVLVKSRTAAMLRTNNPASFSFADLGSGHWAQIIGNNSSGNLNFTSIVVSDAPTVTCTNIDLNNIQPLTLTFSALLPTDAAPYLLYPYHLPTNSMGSMIEVENPPGADNGFVYSPYTGTITISAKQIAQYIADAQSALKADPLGACRMEIIVEGSGNVISVFYADFTITRGSTPGPTPAPIPATFDATNVAVPLACLFTGITLCLVSAMLRRRCAGSN